MREYIENNGIILKRNVDENGNVFSVRVKAEHKQVYKSTVMLEGIPSSFHRVFIEGFIENIPHNDDLPMNTYNVDYNSGKIYFNPAHEGAKVVCDYYSLGTELIKAERVITTYLEGENFALSFAEEIRQNQELRDALIKEIEGNTSIRIVASDEWCYTPINDEEQSFLIDDTIFNPVCDLLTVFFNGQFLHANKYTRIGCRIILNDWVATPEDTFSFIIYKHVVGEIPIDGDGSLIMDGSIGRHKLSIDLQEDISLIPELDKNINELNTRVDNANEEISNIKEDIIELQTKSEEHSENIQEIKETIVSEVERLDNEFTIIHEEIEDIAQHLNSEVERLEDVANDLAETLADTNNTIIENKEAVDIEIQSLVDRFDQLPNFDGVAFGYNDIVEVRSFTGVAIQEAIDTLNAKGGGLVLLPQGTYLVTENIRLYSNISIVGVGEATIKRVDESNVTCVLISDLDVNVGGYNGIKNIYIHNITFDGKQSDDQNYGLIGIGHGNNIRIKNCRFKNLSNRWHMIELNGVQHATIEECSFENYTGGTESIQLDFMCSTNIREDGLMAVFPFSAKADDTYCKNITIKNNSFTNITGCAIGNHTFQVGVMTQYTTIENNYFENISDRAINFGDVTNFTVKDNKFYNCSQAVNLSVQSNSPTDIFIEGNYIDGKLRKDSSQEGRGVTISQNGAVGFCNVFIVNNYIKNCYKYGIGVTGENVVINKNTVYDNGLHGCWLYGGSKFHVTNNIMYNNNTRNSGGYYDIMIGGNASLNTRYANIIDNTIYTAGLGVGLFPSQFSNNNFMTVPYVASDASYVARNNFVYGAWKDTGL